MHLNYHFLRHLAARLSEILTNATLVETFSQEKNELIIVLELTNKSVFYIKATLTNTFSCLSFLDDFKRSRKNSVNLFEEVYDQKVTEVYQFLNERAFSIVFESGKSLLFKLHGNRSNIILIEDDAPSKLFKSGLKKDLDIDVAQLNRHLNPGYDDFVIDPEFRSHFPTYGNVVKQWLATQGYTELSLEDKWAMLEKVGRLVSKGDFYITTLQGKPVFSLLEFESGEPLGDDPIKAINSFNYRFSKVYYFESIKSEKLRNEAKRRKQLVSYIEKSKEKLHDLENGPQPREIGDIIMANLHQITPGSTEVVLHNFYTGSDLAIRLNSKLTPQKNAENYYRKGKNRQIEIDQITQSIQSKQNAIEEVDVLIAQIEASTTNKELTAIFKNQSNARESDRSNARLPYKEFEVNGFKVWVGKNAKSNDELSLKYRYKEDLWLHVKDVPGSHVLIKYDSNRKFDTPTIEKVAEITAFYSKRKTDSLAPVIYTPAKYVRKRKGSLPGEVIVEKENVILVTPRDPSKG